jgi:hypothetical protein
LYNISKNPKMVPEMKTVNNSAMVSGEYGIGNALYK